MKIRFFYRFLTTFDSFHSFLIKNTLSGNPLHELCVVDLAGSFDNIVIRETFFNSRQSYFLQANILPNAQGVLWFYLIKDLKHALDKFTELIETESH